MEIRVGNLLEKLCLVGSLCCGHGQWLSQWTWMDFVAFSNPTGQPSTRFEIYVRGQSVIRKYIKTLTISCFFIIRRTSVFSFMHSKDSPFWRLQCQLVEPQCFLSLISSAWPNTSPSTLPLPRGQDRGGPPQIQRSPHWSSGMLSWNINQNAQEKNLQKSRDAYFHEQIISWNLKLNLSSFSSCVLRFFPSGNCGPYVPSTLEKAMSLALQVGRADLILSKILVSQLALKGRRLKRNELQSPPRHDHPQLQGLQQQPQHCPHSCNECQNPANNPLWKPAPT